MVKTILIADKDHLFVEQMRQRFLSQGYRVLVARNSGEAEHILVSTRPDVVITEIILDHMDAGFCLAWSVKKRYPDVPVIIVSNVTWHTGLYFGLSTKEDKNWIRADCLLNKPIRAEELESVILTQLQKAKAV